MNTIRLTRRGKILMGILVTAALLVIYALGMDLVTPEACKVSIEEMSTACRLLL